MMSYHNDDYYKQKLLEEKERLIGQIKNLEDKNYTGLDHSLRESTSELSNYDTIRLTRHLIRMRERRI